jgi:hypothetical protein
MSASEGSLHLSLEGNEKILILAVARNIGPFAVRSDSGSFLIWHGRTVTG